MMKVTVKLFATLRKNNEKEMVLDLAEDATPKDIMDRLSIPEEDAAIIMINGRGVKIDTRLTESDVVAIFPPVGGG